MSEGVKSRQRIEMPGKLVTIDSASTMDVDDAFVVCARDDGRFEAVFCIADPTELVKIDSTEDANARLLGATVYNRDAAVRKMLPRHISEFKGSLMEGQDRHVLWLRVRIGAEFNVESFELGSGLAKVDKRLHYDEIPAILKDEAHACHGEMRAAQALAHGIMNARRKRGAMVLYDLQRMVFLDEEGRLKQMARREDVVGYIIVQEMMVLLNTLVARYMTEHDVPGLFRNHVAKASAPMGDELAQTIRTWLESPDLDLAKAESTFRMVLGKAAYGATVLGHYGVSEPVYTHVSSPLRRYADLVNMRQLQAHLKKEAFAYDRAALGTLGLEFNEKAELRKEERSEGFKQVVVRHAEQAIERGRVHLLADHELAQAIALNASRESLPDVLVDELIRRLDSATVTDKITDRMLVGLRAESWSVPLKDAFTRWVREAPTRANHLLLHGKQSEWLAEVEIASSGEGTAFTGFVRVVSADGRSGTFSGGASRKKDAEQLACVKAVLWLVGSESIDDQALAATEKAKVSGNPKGLLMEYCQKRAWQMPEFVSTGKGPSHAMIFSCTVTLQAGKGDRRYERSVSGAANKKEAEALASARMLEALGIEEQPEKTAQKGPEASKMDLQNPVGALQEMAQKAKVSEPQYTFETVSITPPKFRAVVKVVLPQVGSFNGEGSTKQDAKKRAALEALTSASMQRE